MSDLQTLRVVTWNIEEGGNGRLDAIHGVLSRSRADVIALQEVTSQANLVDIANRLGMEWVFDEAQNGYHLAWLSQQPIRRSINHRSPALARALLEIEIDWAGTPVSLFAAHLTSRHDRQLPLDEIGLIVRQMEIAGGNPHLLVGDFNALAPGDPVGTPPDGVVPRGDALPGASRKVIDHLLESRYTDCFRQLHPTSPGFTYLSWTPWLRLDYMFASPQLAELLHHCQIIPSSETLDASDHLPLLAILQKAEII